MIPDGAGIDSREIMSVVAAVLGADSTGMTGELTSAEIDRRLEARIAEASAAGKEDLAHQLRTIKSEVGAAIRAAGDRTADRARKIPMFGKRAAAAITAEAQAAADRASAS